MEKEPNKRWSVEELTERVANQTDVIILKTNRQIYDTFTDRGVNLILKAPERKQFVVIIKLK
jgi:hypothetical protein